MSAAFSRSRARVQRSWFVSGAPGGEDEKERPIFPFEGELLAPRVARLSECEGRGDEHALVARVFVSVPLALTPTPACGGRASST